MWKLETRRKLILEWHESELNEAKYSDNEYIVRYTREYDENIEIKNYRLCETIAFWT